jgi:hypothetical protein
MSLFVLALVSGALVCAGAQAESKQKRHQSTSQVEADAAGELTVKKRSFLDPGNVVPVGTQNRYMDDSTFYQSPAPGGTYRNDLFGDWMLPGPFNLPAANPRAPW